MPCKPSALCSSLLPNQRKKKGESSLGQVVEPRPLAWKGNVAAAAVARSKGRTPPTALASSSTSIVTLVGSGKLAVDDGVGKAKSRHGASTSNSIGNPTKPLRRSSSQVHREFLRTTAGASHGFFSSPDDLPACDEALVQFKSTYPRYSETRVLDELREQEYAHLEDDDGTACLDYCGFGLLSQAQHWETEGSFSSSSSTAASFGLMEISANLWSHALFGAAPEGTMEGGLRKRIMQFLNIPDAEYSMVFTASRGSTFKLLADAYPWESSGSLITMYDYESESVGFMEQKARERRARVYRTSFRWPSLRVCSRELKKELMAGSRKQKRVNQDLSWLERLSSRQQPQSEKTKSKGLFVFPAQSRVSGAKYSYQWMSLAQQNKWHVLLDASALGPKDMDSLGLSLFRPDFITASFYRLFGGDPSGFGCLFIKNSVAQSIQDPSGAPVSGMARIVPFPSVYSAFNGSSTSADSEVDEGQMMSSFSGPMIYFNDLPNCHRMPGMAEENDSSACEDNASVGEISRSPVFSEDGNETTFYTDACPSPVGSASCASLSEEGFSGPLQEDPVHHLSAHLAHGRKETLNSCPPSRSRIKGLCSGLLHRHTGRVGNSADSVGEEEYNVQQSTRELDLVKYLECHKIGQSEVGQPGFDESHTPRITSIAHETKDNGLKEVDKADRLVVVLRKLTKEQEPLDTEEISMGFSVKEHEKHIQNLSRVKGGDSLYQHMEGTLEEKTNLGGLETIAELEAEVEYSRSLGSESGISRGGRLVETSWSQKDSAICRETERDFRLLGRRNGEPFSIGKIFSTAPSDDSFRKSLDSGGSEVKHDPETQSDEEFVDQVVTEPYLVCRSLDHADMLGLNKTSFRLRYLINWLISSLLRLRHTDSNLFLVKIYGPQVRYDRGASIAFNLFDNEGRMLHPELVRLLADQTNISLGLGFLRNINFGENLRNVPVPGFLDATGNGQPKNLVTMPSRVEVVTAALGLLSDFRDVYRMWVFVARFLDPDFVTMEGGRFQISSEEPGS